MAPAAPPQPPPAPSPAAVAAAADMGQAARVSRRDCPRHTGLVPPTDAAAVLLFSVTV
jgi:hypothetical protein